MRLLTDPFFIRFCLLAAAAAVAGVLAAWALGNALGRRTTGFRALLPFWLPVAFAVLGVGMSDPSLAITLLYSSSVCAVTLLLGSALYFTATFPPVYDTQAEPPTPLLLLLLPLVAMLWLIGFAGRVDRVSGLALVIAGVVVARAAWPRSTPAPTRASGHPALAAVEAALGLMAAIGAALASWHLGGFVRTTGPRLPVELVAVTPLAPILGIPLYVGMARIVQQHRRPQAAALGGGIVLLNIAFLLPALLVVSGVNRAVHPTNQDASATTTLASRFFDAVLGIPLILWRIESVILVIAVLALVGLKLGYYGAGRALGAGLLILYVLYLLASIALRLS